jgi:hypothetical protein
MNTDSHRLKELSSICETDPHEFTHAPMIPESFSADLIIDDPEVSVQCSGVPTALTKGADSSAGDGVAVAVGSGVGVSVLLPGYEKVTT